MSVPGATAMPTQVLDAWSKGQEAVWRCAGLAGENVAAMLRSGPSGILAGTPAEMVDRTIDAQIELLEAQRAAAHGLLDAVGSIAPGSMTAATGSRSR